MLLRPIIVSMRKNTLEMYESQLREVPMMYVPPYIWEEVTLYRSSVSESSVVASVELLSTV